MTNNKIKKYFIEKSDNKMNVDNKNKDKNKNKDYKSNRRNNNL